MLKFKSCFQVLRTLLNHVLAAAVKDELEIRNRKPDNRSHYIMKCEQMQAASECLHCYALIPLDIDRRLHGISVMGCTADGHRPEMERFLMAANPFLYITDTFGSFGYRHKKPCVSCKTCICIGYL